MASCCGGCLALMDAGVPITKPVAGISVGLVQEGDNTNSSPTSSARKITSAIWTSRSAAPRRHHRDPVGHQDRRDHPQDYSRHAAPCQRGPAEDSRKMFEALPGPRKEISEFAPHLLTIKIDPEKIGKIIGPGGKNIKASRPTPAPTSTSKTMARSTSARSMARPQRAAATSSKR